MSLLLNKDSSKKKVEIKFEIEVLSQFLKDFTAKVAKMKVISNEFVYNELLEIKQALKDLIQLNNAFLNKLKDSY